MKTFLLVALLIFLTQLTAVHTDELYVRVGDMVVLNCPYIKVGSTETPPSWTTPLKRLLTHDMNSTSPFLIHQRSLILLKASRDHQGNYSCSVGKHTFWSKLVVSALSDDDQKVAQYTSICYTKAFCTLYCPMSNTPASVTPNMSRLHVSWEKGGRSELRDTLSFISVKETDQGTFSCTRSYLYQGQIYNRTFNVKLVVKPQEPLPKVEIVTPHDREVFEVKLGSDFKVNCTATISDFDEVYWTVGESFVDTDPNSRVYSKNTVVQGGKKSHMTALLTFGKVLEEDLSKGFTCTLESTEVEPQMVTISLQPKKPLPQVEMVSSHVGKVFDVGLDPIFLIMTIVGTILVMTAVALIIVKFKMDIFLFIRDRSCFHNKSGEIKLYDATLLCYKSASAMALSEDDLKWLENALDKELGYKVCVHRSNPSGQEKSKLDITEQSHAIILVPVLSSPGPGPDRSLTEVCSSMDTSSSRVILIQTPGEKCSRSSFRFHETALLLEHVQKRIVIWKGTTSSQKSFLKYLQFHMPPQNPNERMVV